LRASSSGSAQVSSDASAYDASFAARSVAHAGAVKLAR